jgi:hypothetical protein
LFHHFLSFPQARWREEHRLRVFNNRVLRNVLRSKKDEVAGECRKLHNEQLCDLYCSPNIVRLITSRKMRWAGHVARMGDRRGAYKVLVGRPEGKRVHVRRKHRWENKSKWIFKKWEGEFWTGLIWVRIGTGGGLL